MFRIFFSLICFSAFLFADNFETNFQATVAAEPSVMLEDCVNLVTGQLYLNNVDIIAEGKEPIYYSRYYSSILARYPLDKLRDWKYITEEIKDEGWGSDKHVSANIGYDLIETKNNCTIVNRRVEVYEPNGTMLSFDFPTIKPPEKRLFGLRKAKDTKKQKFETKKAEIRPLRLIENPNFYQRSITNAKDNYKNTKATAMGEHNLRIESSDGMIRHYYRENAAYGPYSLQWEILPNGNKLEYVMEYQELKEIKSKSPSGKIYARLMVNRHYNKDKTIEVKTNAQKVIKYEYKKEKIQNEYKLMDEKNYLRHKIAPYGNETFEYHQGKFFLLKNCIYPKNRLFHIEYHDNFNSQEWKRVSGLKSYLGKSPDFKNIYWINYDQIAEFNKDRGQTNVVDANNHQTKYFFSKQLRLDQIERFEKINGQEKLKNTEKFIWQDNGFFLGQVFYDENQIAIKAIKNIFDNTKGNITKKIIYGNITGKCNKPIELHNNNLPVDNGIDTYVQSYTYSTNNLIKSEIDQNSYGTENTYLSMKIEGHDFETNLPLTKFITFNSQIKKRFFYSYDIDNILIEEIEDDGISRNKDNLDSVTRRTIKRIEPRSQEPYGLADCIKEYYYDSDEKIEKFLKKEKYEYSKSCKVIRKEVYGSDNELKYTLNYEYDPIKDNLISETDPLGREAFYQYDENFNKTYEKTFDNKEIFFEYDLCNRLISKTIKDSEQDHIEEYEYDGKHNKISQKDFYGNITRYNYNSNGNVIEEIFPEIEDSSGNTFFPKKSYEYDGLFRQIKKTDEEGNSTIISYNIFDKPIKIEYPDKTTEEFEYNLDGTLKHRIDQIQTKTEYTYDYLKRVLSQKIISPIDGVLLEEYFEYDAFKLISKTDPEGNTTKYTYDGAGRKIKEEVFSKDQSVISKETFFYDELGFLKKRVKADSLFTFYERDLLGRILEENQKDSNETELSKVKYLYNDEENNKITILDISGKESIKTETFDSLDRLIKVEDALKNTTTYFYDTFYNVKLDQNVKRITTNNSINQQIIKIFDSLNREWIIENIDPNGKTISYEEKFYDLKGNLEKQISSIYINPQEVSKIITTKWQYDTMNRLVELVEAYGSDNSKTTKYSYTDKGQKEKIIKPDLNVLFYEYDFLGNNTRIYSAKKDLDYYFEYNKLKQVVLAKDFDNFITRRKYDFFGNILEEHLSNGLSISNEYDFLNNKTKTTFQDGSYVEYKYDPLYLKEITRKDINGLELYKHEYLNYDLAGNLLKESLILDSGDVEYSIDKLSRVTEIKTPFHSQLAEYDSIGRISTIEWQGFLDNISQYKYDDLNQIISETGLFSNNYQFDSHNNRLLKNSDFYKINDLNQVNATDDFVYEYDENGNLVEKTSPKGTIIYEYDSLDRLIQVRFPSSSTLEFVYDPFNRRMSKNSKHNSYFAYDDFKYFLYDNQNEIGSFDENFNQKELRILSDTNKAEIGSAIAFEIDGYIYAPIYDISGNVTSLIYNGSLYEHYKYSVFGERKIYSSWGYEKNSSQINNPWQFSSKRIDEETHLIYYGRRYYDPLLGRWVTPDPQGFSDGLNLYTFVNNDPLINVDLYGLEILAYHLPGPSYYRAMDKYYDRKPTQYFHLNKPEISQHQRIYFSNGIYNSLKEAKQSAKYLSKIINNSNIHTIYNEHLGVGSDISRAGMSLLGVQSKASKMIANEWMKYLDQNEENNILHICHSEGNINTRNALRRLPEKYRERINVLGIAPAAYMTRNLAKSIAHYSSSRDIVPRFDVMGRLHNYDNISILSPHKNATTFFDHSFKSPTYELVIKTAINSFLNKNEVIK